jgi:hypothetical protein
MYIEISHHEFFLPVCVSQDIAAHFSASFEAFTVVVFQVEVFWVMTSCSVEVGYQHVSGSL